VFPNKPGGIRAAKGTTNRSEERINPVISLEKVDAQVGANRMNCRAGLCKKRMPRCNALDMLTYTLRDER